MRYVRSLRVRQSVEKLCKDWGCRAYPQASTTTINSQEADRNPLKFHAGGDTRAMQSVVPKACPLSAHVLGVYKDIRGYTAVLTAIAA